MLMISMHCLSFTTLQQVCLYKIHALSCSATVILTDFQLFLYIVGVVFPSTPTSSEEYSFLASGPKRRGRKNKKVLKKKQKNQK